jgi:hypothetical protein
MAGAFLLPAKLWERNVQVTARHGGGLSRPSRLTVPCDPGRGLGVRHGPTLDAPSLGPSRVVCVLTDKLTLARGVPAGLRVPRPGIQRQPRGPNWPAPSEEHQRDGVTVA